MKLGTMKAQLPWALEEADLSFCLQGSWKAREVLAPLGETAFVADNVDALVAAIVKAARPGDHVLCMSNGRLRRHPRQAARETVTTPEAPSAPPPQGGDASGPAKPVPRRPLWSVSFVEGLPAATR